VKARIYAYMPLPIDRTIVESDKKFIGLAKVPLVRALLSSPLQGMPLKPA
jgi:hypothetical protein